MPYILVFLIFAVACSHSQPIERYSLSPSEVLEKSQKTEWRSFKQEDLVYLELPEGTVVFELAPWFAPERAENIKNLLLAKFWDGAPVIRSHDNYVAQWGYEEGFNQKKFDFKKANIKKKMARLEYEIPIPKDGHFESTGHPDAYAAQVGYFNEFPVAHDHKNLWITHCYGIVGVSRDVDPWSGNGESLYVVTGHSPRHLDRNINLVGRVVSGIELLSSLPRGQGPLGFYKDKKNYVTIKMARLGTQLNGKDHLKMEVLKTDSLSYRNWVAAKKARKEAWFYQPAGAIDVCNASPPMRLIN